MRKLPRKHRGRQWSLNRKRFAAEVLWLAKRRRARAALHAVPATLGLLDGLVAYWKLNEPPEFVREDSSGNGLHLNDNNGVGQFPGRIDDAAEFAYVEYDRWLDHEDDPALRFDSDFTVALWVYRTGAGFNANVILNKTDAFYLYSHGDVEFRPMLDLLDDGGNYLGGVIGNAIIEENQWHHVVVYRAGTEIGVVVDAGEAAKLEGITGAINVGGTFRIGAHEGGYPFTGLIDDAVKWNRCLTPQEISQIYNGGLGLEFENFTYGT